MTAKHFLMALICASVWGLNFPLIKLITTEMPPIFSTAVRLSIVGCGIFFVKRPSGEWLKTFFLSLTLFTLTLAPTTYAIREVDASIAAFLNELEVPFAALLGYLLIGEKLKRAQLFGMLLAFIGVFLIVKSPEISTGDWFPVVLLVIAAFFYGFSAVFIKFFKGTGALSLTIWSSFFAAIELYLLSYFVFEQQEIMTLVMPSTKILITVVCSSLISLTAFYIWNHLIGLYKVNQVVPFGMLLPIFSLVFSYFLLGETTHWVALLGGSMTLVGVWFQSY